jgi:hypothetical protein
MAVPCSAPALSIATYRIINHIKGLPLETHGNSAMRMIAISQHSCSPRNLLSVCLNLRELSRRVDAVRLADPADREEFDALVSFWLANREKITLACVTLSLWETLFGCIVKTVQKKHYNALMSLYRQQLELVMNLMELGIGPDIKGIPGEVLGDGIRIDRLGRAGVP